MDSAAAPHHSRWAVAATDGSLDVTFTPTDAIPGQIHVGIVEADLYHMWGVLRGRLTVNSQVFAINDVVAVLEEHYAVW